MSSYRALRGAAAVAALLVGLSFSGCSLSTLDGGSGDILSESELRAEADAVDRRVVEQDMVLEDPELERYLSGVVARLLAAGGSHEGDIRVRVISNPILGASALANGVLHIHTGMLARLENEAQLATLLGHELEHYLGRHAVREMHLRSNPTMSANALVAGGGEADFDGIIQRFERNLEREADDAGLQRMAAAGYDPGQASRFFEMLLAEEVAAGVVRDDQRGNHPAAHDRLVRCQARVDELAANARGADLGRERYERAIASMLLVNAQMDFEAGQLDSARQGIRRHLRVASPSRSARELLASLQTAAR